MTTKPDEQRDHAKLADKLVTTDEPKRPPQAKLRMEGWESLYHWLNWRIGVNKCRIAGYKAAKKTYKTKTFDGQIKYWENQNSTYEDIRENLIKANSN